MKKINSTEAKKNVLHIKTVEAGRKWNDCGE